jgi:hypothetical protein
MANTVFFTRSLIYEAEASITFHVIPAGADGPMADLWDAPAMPLPLRPGKCGSLPDREHPGPASRVTQRRIATPTPQGSSQGGRR